MTVKELIRLLLDEPRDAVVWVGKGIGPVGEVVPDLMSGADTRIVILKPEGQPS